MGEAENERSNRLTRTARAAVDCDVAGECMQYDFLRHTHLVHLGDTSFHNGLCVFHTTQAASRSSCRKK